ncbi:hypothetical protein G6F56_011135 [Rhizopus delemar]|nr:hypothetical protein G6F56_011135 [Rhizopus delemar]
MSDFNYSLAKDSTKSVPLYHHEQVPFQSFYRQSNNGNNVNHNNNTNHTVSPLLNNTVKSADQNNNPASGDLQDIIYSYQTQPELLKLILSSKLEEDKRRAEEAKLKAKELDLLLIQQQQQMPLGNTHHANGNHPNYNNNSNNNNHNNNNHNSNNNNNNNNNNDNHHHHDIANLFQTPLTNTFVQSTPPISQGSSADGKMYQTIRRTSLDAILSTPLLPSQQQQQQQRIQHRRNSNLDSSFTADSDELEDQTFSPISTSTTTPVSTSSLLHMDR